MNILIAEDDKFIASAYRVKFANQGWDVTMASNGQEVIEQLKVHHPDLILLDLIMPIMDGFEVLEQLQKNSSNQVPIIVASNLGQKEDKDRALKLGAIDYFVKSDMTLETLIGKIKQHLKIK